MFKSIIILCLSTLLFAGCAPKKKAISTTLGGESQPIEEDNIDQDLGPDIVQYTPEEIQQKLVGNIYCEENPSREDNGDLVAQHFSFFANNIIHFSFVGNAHNTKSFGGSWGLSGKVLTMKINIAGESQRLKAYTGFKLSGVLVLNLSGSIITFNPCGKTADIDLNNATVTPDSPDSTLPLMNIIKGNLFCNIEDINHQVYFAFDNRYSEARVSGGEDAEPILNGVWSLENNILVVSGNEVSAVETLLDYTYEGILVMTRDLSETNFKVCY